MGTTRKMTHRKTQVENMVERRGKKLENVE